MDEKNRNEFLDMVENKLENVSGNDIQDLESF
jgi:MerR family transcriptional regulator, heat shock protein HspR